ARDPLLGLCTALEPDLAVAERGLDAVECLQEVGLPGGAAELAVGDRFQPDRFLFGDQLADFRVLDLCQRRGIDLAALTFRAGIAQGRRTEQAADMVSP